MSVLVGIPVLIIRPGDADADIYINHRGFSLATLMRAVGGRRVVAERCLTDSAVMLFLFAGQRDQQRINSVTANE